MDWKSHRRLLAKYKNKLAAHGFLRALLLVLAAGAGALFITLFIYHLIGEKPPVVLAAGIPGAVFALTLLISYFVMYFPTKKKVARALDDAGLQDRESAALAFKDNGSEIAELQRKDAHEKLQSFESKDLKLKTPRRQIVSALICVVLCAAIVTIFYGASRAVKETHWKRRLA